MDFIFGDMFCYQVSCGVFALKSKIFNTSILKLLAVLKQAEKSICTCRILISPLKEDSYFIHL